MGKFQNKVVIVTGSSSGIGEVTAINFAKEGAKVVVTGRNKERVDAVASKCKDAGAEVHAFVGDLADFNNLKAIVDETVGKFGGVDILVNNAGFAVFNNIDEFDAEGYDKMFDVNVRAPVFLCKYAFPHLKKSKGCVVNISSITSKIVNPGNVPYSMTKAALDHFTRGFSAECAPFGIRVNAINPGMVWSRSHEEVASFGEDVQKAIESFQQRQPLGSIYPRHVLEAIFYLCTSEMTTGITLCLTAGLTH